MSSTGSTSGELATGCAGFVVAEAIRIAGNNHTKAEKKIRQDFCDKAQRFKADTGEI
jgi:hypothetical protein